MAKKQSFADKAKKKAGKDGATVEHVRWVKAYKAENGAWKFRTVNIAVTDKNRSEVFE